MVPARPRARRRPVLCLCRCRCLCLCARLLPRAPIRRCGTSAPHSSFPAHKVHQQAAYTGQRVVAHAEPEPDAAGTALWRYALKSHGAAAPPAPAAPAAMPTVGGSVCGVCRETAPAADAAVVVVGGRRYHAGCCRCGVCGLRFVGAMAPTVAADGRLLCFLHS
jgi:hypothetical protein